MSRCVDCGMRLSYVHRCQAPGAGHFDRERHARDVEWFNSTGHCGGGGQPGDWCQCGERSACGCRALHEMGSGIGRDAADVFSDVAPVVVEQDGLFG